MRHDLTVGPIRKFSKVLSLPGDKSISHRAVIVGSIAKGKTEIRNFLRADDCLHTLKAFEKMGIAVKVSRDRLLIEGKGLHGLRRPRGPIYLGNSGTSMRLLSGILAGQPFTATLKGDPSLSRRPMRRVLAPLEAMGAEPQARRREFPPLTILGGKLRGIRYRMPVPSAQVKSAILLAGLYAEGTTTVIEKARTRDHTERMLRQFGKPVSSEGISISVEGGGELHATRLDIPGDISSAAFFIVLTSALEGARLTLKGVGLNPTRTGFLQILKRMGARVVIHPGGRGRSRPGIEPFGDIEVKGTSLYATQVDASEIPGLIDELPILMVAAALAKGKSVFRKASELRVKETDRIYSMVTGLKKMGVCIWNERDDVWIEGGRPLVGTVVESFKDHRTAMSLAVAGRLARKGKTVIRDSSCIQTSFPGFANLI